MLAIRVDPIILTYTQMISVKQCILIEMTSDSLIHEYDKDDNMKVIILRVKQIYIELS